MSREILMGVSMNTNTWADLQNKTFQSTEQRGGEKKLTQTTVIRC